jgi:hypothetical protein
LAAITTVDPAADVLPIVDISDTSMAASGTTKKITSNQILGAGGTATLASATITGAATVGTTLGVTGVSTFAAGTALLPALTTTGDVNTGIYYPAADTFAVTTGGTERYRVDSSGNVGVGVTPSASWVTYKALEFDTGIVSGSSSMALNRNCYFDGVNWRYKVTTSFGIAQYQLSGNGNHIWNIASSGSAGAAINGGTGAWTQAMTLDASGNLLVGTTDTGSNSGIGIKSVYSSTAPYVSTVGSSNASNVYSYLLYSTTDAAFKFYVSYSGTVSATNGTISAISDARLKENVQDIDVGLGAILALKPRKFDWKAGKGKDIKGDRGFIAQEFEQVFPNLIDEWKDPAPEGEAPYKSVRQDLIPVLVKAIQELAAEVNALKNA